MRVRVQDNPKAFALTLSVAGLVIACFIGSASAQLSKEMYTIEGKYAAPQFELTIPEGWKGAVVPAGGLFIASVEQLESNATGQVGTVMFVALTSIEQASTINPHSQFYRCDLSASFVKVAGQDAKSFDIGCEEYIMPDGSASRQPSLYSVHELYSRGEDRYIISLWYVAQADYGEDPRVLFDRDLPAYRTLLDSLVVRDAADIRTAFADMPSLSMSIHEVGINNDPVSVEFYSSSSISSFAASQQENTVSFNVSGTNGTSGMTAIKIGGILEGPYAATIDGEPMTARSQISDPDSSAFFVVTDTSPSDTIALLTYPHSEHEIVITGTRVVPEFPFVLLAAGAGISGAMLMIRLRTHEQ